MTGRLCGAPHHNYAETLCTEPAGHYVRDRDPHAGPLIINGRERGGASWDEPKDTMTGRHTVDTITSDALDALYDRLARARNAVSLHRKGLITTAELYAVIEAGPAATKAAETEKTARLFAALHRSAEEDVTRVIDLYERWVKAGPPPLGTSMSRWWDARLAELHDAIRPPACTCTYGARCANCRD